MKLSQLLKLIRERPALGKDGDDFISIELNGTKEVRRTKHTMLTKVEDYAIFSAHGNKVIVLKKKDSR